MFKTIRGRKDKRGEGKNLTKFRKDRKTIKIYLHYIILLSFHNIKAVDTAEYRLSYRSFTLI